MIGCSQAQKANKTTTPVLKDSVVKIQMNLSAFVVESGRIPSINMMIDFLQDTSIAVKTLYSWEQIRKVIFHAYGYYIFS